MVSTVPNAVTAASGAELVSIRTWSATGGQRQVSVPPSAHQANVAAASPAIAAGADPANQKAAIPAPAIIRFRVSRLVA